MISLNFNHFVSFNKKWLNIELDKEEIWHDMISIILEKKITQKQLTTHVSIIVIIDRGFHHKPLNQND